MKKEICEFVAVDDPVKLYLVNLTNVTDRTLDVDVNYWINPTFGNFEEKTARHILSEFIDDKNAITYTSYIELEGNKIVFEKLDEGKDEKVKMTWDVVNNKVVCKKAN